MTDIHDINLDHVHKFLIINKIPTQNLSNDELYERAFWAMKNEDGKTTYKNVDTSILEWVLAYNILHGKKKPNIKKYSRTEIERLSNTELKKLAESLGMNSTNIESVIHILQYLDKYEAELKFGETADLFESLILNQELKEVISLFKTNKKLFRPIIIKLLPEIIKERKDTDNQLYNDNYRFIKELVKMGEVDLIKKVIIIDSKFKPNYQRYFFYDFLFDEFVKNNMLDKYYEMLPEDYLEGQSIFGLMESINLYQYRNNFDVAYQSLLYAIKKKHYSLIRFLIKKYEYNDEMQLSKFQVDQMNSLIKIAKNILSEEK